MRERWERWDIYIWQMRWRRAYMSEQRVLDDDIHIGLTFRMRPVVEREQKEWGLPPTHLSLLSITMNTLSPLPLSGTITHALQAANHIMHTWNHIRRLGLIYETNIKTYSCHFHTLRDTPAIYACRFIQNEKFSFRKERAETRNYRRHLIRVCRQLKRLALHIVCLTVCLSFRHRYTIIYAVWMVILPYAWRCSFTNNRIPATTIQKMFMH